MITSDLDEDLQSAPVGTPDTQPSWMLAADNHNVASGNRSWYDMASGTLESLANAPKFVGLSIGSGVTGVLNSGIAVGNWFSNKATGTDLTSEINFGKWVSEYDEDMGKYYRDNADSIDIAGFIGTSLVPGTLGVKALNMGQRALRVSAESGTIAKNFSWATKLLPDTSANYIRQSAEAIAATNQRIKILEKNSMKAIGLGFGQAALEAAAFEGFVFASSFKSPFFDNMETSDIIMNATTGILLGGGIGGIIAGAATRGAVKRAVVALDQPGKLAITQTAISDSLPEGFRASQNFLNREVKEGFLAESNVALDAGALPDGLTAGIVKKNVANTEATIMDLNNQIRTSVAQMTTEPQAANEFADVILKMNSREGANLMLGSESLFRVGDAPKQSMFRGFMKQMDLAGVPKASAAESEGVLWNKMWGEHAGKVFDETPQITQLADRLKIKKGQEIIDAVRSRVADFRFDRSGSFSVTKTGNSLDAVQSRYVWASTKQLSGEQTILASDFPLLEAAFNQFDKVGKVKIIGAKGKVLAEIDDATGLMAQVKALKDQAAKKLITKDKMTLEEIAERLNMKPGYLDQTGISPSAYENYFHKQGLANQMEIEYPTIFGKPSYMGVKSNKDVGTLLNEMEMDAAQVIAAQEKVAQQTKDAAVAEAGRIAGQSEFVSEATGARGIANLTEYLPEASVINEAVSSAARTGSGARIFSFANGSYGSLESMMQHIGAVTKKMTSNMQSAVQERLKAATDLLRSDAKVAAEYSVTRERIASTGETYVLRRIPKSANPDDGLVPALVPKKLVDGTGANTLNAGAPEAILFSDPRTAKVWEAHIALNSERQAGRQTLRASQGLEDDRVAEAAYAIKPDPRKTPYFAFVTDPTLTGAGKTTMIHATTADNLEAMIRKVKSELPNFNVIRNDQSKAYHKALGDYEYDKTLHENYIDSTLANRGINSQRLPRTDGNFLADEMLDWHNKQVRGYVSDIISTKYETAFKELEAMGRHFGGLQSSKYSNASELAAEVRQNPYVEYVKTALNVSNMSEYPLLVGVNQALDNVVSGLWNRASDMFRSIKGVTSGELDAVNKVFADHGFKTAYYDAATHLLANHSADQGVLSKFIRGANSVLATTLLRMDFLNALNNKMGSAIMTSAEVRHVINAINKGDEASVGRLAQIAKTKIPDTGDMMFTPSRLMARSYKNFFERPDLRARYIEEGFVPREINEAFNVIENLTLQGGESALVLNEKLKGALDGAKKIGDFGEKITGNKFTEQLNRFVAADVMRQLTDVAIEGGLMTAREARSYINTFVNRTQVNLTASQRPLAFQGPLGMALGLFQSYQFNMMQQLFRYVQPGSRKAAAQLLGMQTSIYGMNGLPGYQAFNENIIGQAAGNYEHKDVSTTIREAAGNDLGNFFLYGIPSNLLRANLYTRGDLTPQHPTIFPTSVGEIPFVSSFSKFLGNLYNTTQNMAGGAGVWRSVLSGLEHNSLNRPLAGLAQVLRGVPDGNIYAADRSGNLLSANDMLSLATVARLAGGKPLDEAVVRDESFRMQAYKQSNRERMAKASGHLRLALAEDGEASDKAMDSIFNLYLNTGGKASQFNQWYMRRYMEANTSRSYQLANKLSDPYAQRMQGLLGGDADSMYTLY